MERMQNHDRMDAAGLDTAVATLVLAFNEDPLMRWVFDSPEQYLTYAPRLIRVIAGNAFASDSAQLSSDGRAVACWTPPRTHHDDASVLAIVSEACAPQRLAAVIGMIEQLDGYRPAGDFWYLSMLGVEPVCRAKGYGASLLAQRLCECDAARLPASLWSSNERNLSFYQRQGFEVQARLQKADAPPIFPMLRAPR
ncbi:GNAT family N-acetyltransferase [Paraburkholderia humisilvae]|uniref:N-acetyltransferase domain-containing protein n=1 Tax=Paraburkholderia humisilvae TaxID=627669 RepID=A0A6J5E503_9BURK|nr:GNAT family N-acetyltransferase [Paraburkholderia humisilvae]CAB3761589.1 hypothetical protein LMG29542_04123 [Paraburkholderia humisilvae]